MADISIEATARPTPVTAYHDGGGLVLAVDGRTVCLDRAAATALGEFLAAPFPESTTEPAPADTEFAYEPTPEVISTDTPPDVNTTDQEVTP